MYIYLVMFFFMFFPSRLVAIMKGVVKARHKRVDSSLCLMVEAASIRNLTFNFAASSSYHCLYSFFFFLQVFLFSFVPMSDNERPRLASSLLDINGLVPAS